VSHPEQQQLDDMPLPKCNLRINGGRVTAMPTEGAWADNLEVTANHIGDALYLLKLLLRELDRRGEAWNDRRRPDDDDAVPAGYEDVSPTRKVP